MSKSTVSLRVFGDELDPEAVTRVLGHEPSRSYRNGDPVSPGRGLSKRKCGMWLLVTSAAEPEALGEQIESLLSKLTADLQVWRELTARYQVDLYCGFFMDAGNQGFTLPAHVMRQVAARGVDIGFDLYAPISEEEVADHSAQDTNAGGGGP